MPKTLKSHLNSVTKYPIPRHGQDQTEFDDLISALRTGDVFGENIDKFKRNRKSRNSPPRVERMESFLRERSKERILN